MNVMILNNQCTKKRQTALFSTKQCRFSCAFQAGRIKFNHCRIMS